MKGKIIKPILFLIFFTLLIIFCTQDCAFANSSYFGRVDAKRINLFFLRSDKNCLIIELVAVESIISNNIIEIEKVVQAVLEKLLDGPIEQEMERLDLWTAIPENVKINTIRIDDKTVLVDFSKELQNYGGGSLNAICIRGQIEKTLKELPSIEEVVITVEGRDEKDGVLQP